MKPPKTLIEAVRYFSDPANCREYMVASRWPNGVTCPTCGSKTVYFDSGRNGWECRTRHPKRKFGQPLIEAERGILENRAGLRVIKGTGGMGKVAVLGLLERHGKVGHSTIRAAVVPNNRKAPLQAGVRLNVESGSNVYTDAHLSYDGLSADSAHQVIDHAEAYVDGQIHTNGCENFWSLLKRGLKGTYVEVEPFHLFRYVDEQAFRFNMRKMTDAQRFDDVVRGIVGRRLTCAGLIAPLAASAPV